MRRLLLAAVLAFGLGCGGIRVGEVASDLPPRLRRVDVRGPIEITLTPSSDATVNSDEFWRAEPLGEEEWLMVGAAPGREVFWFTYLRFDLGLLDADTRFTSVNLQLPYSPEEPPPMDIYAVVTKWSESTVSWARQPRVDDDFVARITTVGTGCEYACADLTRLANRVVEEGRTELSLLLVPSEPWATSAHRWSSIESLPEGATAGDVPFLAIRAGTPPLPPTAADLDRERGLR